MIFRRMRKSHATIMILALFSTISITSTPIPFLSRGQIHISTTKELATALQPRPSSHICSKSKVFCPRQNSRPSHKVQIDDGRSWESSNQGVAEVLRTIITQRLHRINLKYHRRLLPYAPLN